MRERLWIVILLLILTFAYPLLRAEQYIDMKWPQESEEFHWSCPTDTFVSEDAIVLTLRLQESMFLDTALAFEIDTVLKAARAHVSEVEELGAFPDFKCNDILLGSDAEWTSSWFNGELMTGNAALDSLSSKYNLIAVKGDMLNIFKLEFQQAFKAPWVSLLYYQVDDVRFAEPNGAFGDGPNIEIFNKDGIWHLAFSDGWGDCPSGCIMRYYYYVIVDSQFNVSLIDECERLWEAPKIYTWNIPRWYPLTVFNNGNEVLEVAKSSPEWWIRRHALEVLGRIYAFEKTWAPPDYKNRALFNEIKSNLLSRPDDVRSILSSAKQNPDEHIRETARFGLNQVDSLFQYFPLERGNRWVYGCEDAEDYERNIIATTCQWYGEWPRSEWNNLFDRFYSSRAWVWMDRGAQVFVRVDEREQMWIDFTADVGSSWVVDDFDDQGSSIIVTLQSVTDTVSIPVGIFTECFKFFFEPSSGSFPWAEWYARGVGLVKSSQYGSDVSECILVGAVIDGESIEAAKGDVSDDGVIDVQDVVFIINIILNFEEPDVRQRWTADYNDDSSIDILDVVSLINFILGK